MAKFFLRIPASQSTTTLDASNSRNYGLTFNLLFLAGIVTSGTWFNLGYNIVALNGIESVIVSWLRVTQCDRLGAPEGNLSLSHDSHLFEDSLRTLWCRDNVSDGGNNVVLDLARNSRLDTLWALTSSLFSLGGFVSAVLVGTMIKRFGLKKSILLNAALLIVGTVVSCFSELAGTFEMLIAGRIIAGFAVGSFGVLTPMFISDLSPVTLRGAVGTLPMTTLVVGMIVATFLGLPHVLGRSGSWPILLAMQLIPVLLMFVALPLCPDSPRYLLNQNKKEEAKKALIWLRATPDVQDELTTLQEQMEQGKKQEQLSMLELFRRPLLRWALCLCAIPMSALHLSGFSCLSFYSTFIFTAGGLNHLESVYASLGLWSIFLLTNLISLGLVDRLGRRVLLLTSHTGVIISLCCLVLTMALTKEGHVWAKYGSVASIFVFIIFHGIALFSVPWILGVELFKEDARAAGLTLINMVCWGTEIVSTLPFPLIIAHAEEYTFIIFVVCVLLTGTFTYLYLPETKGKSFDQIQSLLKPFKA